MKIRELGYLMGFKPRPRRYGHQIRTIETQQFGPVQYAQWLHPLEGDKSIDDAELEELRSFLSPGDVTIDIGAHTGDTALPMALTVGPQGCVFAFEPNTYVFPVLKKNASLNSEKTRIVPLMYAVTEEDQSLVFEYSDPGFCNGGRHDNISRWRHGHAFKLTVEGRNLLRLLDEEYPDHIGRIRFIKVDAEGADLSILKSLGPLIQSCRPYIRAEVFKHTPVADRLELMSVLGEWGYTVHLLVPGCAYRGAIVAREDAVSWKHFDIFCVPKD